MLKAIVLGLAARIVLAGPALAQPLPLPALDAGPPALLVKHDKDKHGHGRKLGHYKHRGHDDDRAQRWSSSRGGDYWPYASPPYYGPPGYGSSLPPAYYAPPAYYGPPPY